MEKQEKITDAKRITFGLLIGGIWGILLGNGALRVMRRVKYPQCYDSIYYHSKKNSVKFHRTTLGLHWLITQKILLTLWGSEKL
jgi:hypothetical protein